MPTEAKRATVAELVEAFSASTSAIVADHRGLTVADLGRIRGELRGKGISYTVVKNRLAQDRRGAGGPVGVHAPALRSQRGRPRRQPTRQRWPRASWTHSGPTATWSSVVAPSAAPRSTRTAVTRLATLPPRDVLLGQLAGGFASPLSTMAGLLSAPLRNLGYALTQVRDQRQAA